MWIYMGTSILDTCKFIIIPMKYSFHGNPYQTTERSRSLPKVWAEERTFQGRALHGYCV
jgi:hypothetical protein